MVWQSLVNTSNHHPMQIWQLLTAGGILFRCLGWPIFIGVVLIEPDVSDHLSLLPNSLSPLPSLSSQLFHMHSPGLASIHCQMKVKLTSPVGYPTIKQIIVQ